MFRTGSLSIINSISTVCKSIDICHVSAVGCLQTADSTNVTNNYSFTQC